MIYMCMFCVVAGVPVDKGGGRTCKALYAELPGPDVLQDMGCTGDDAAASWEGSDHARRGQQHHIHHPKADGW